MKIKDKIVIRSAELETLLQAGDHLKSAEGVMAALDLIASITKFTSVLSDADRDFINAARMAVEPSLFTEDALAVGSGAGRG